MSEKRTKFHYRILCKDILIEEKTLDKVIDKLNELAEENEQLREKVKDYEVILSIANSNDVLCEYQEIDDYCILL